MRYIILLYHYILVSIGTKMKKTAFSYVELMVCMAIVIVLFVVALPHMTGNRNGTSSDTFGEFQCYITDQVDKNTNLPIMKSRARYNTNEFPNKDTFEERFGECIFNLPAGKIKAFHVTLIGGGGGGAAGYSNNHTGDEAINLMPVDDSTSGDIVTFDYVIPYQENLTQIAITYPNQTSSARNADESNYCAGSVSLGGDTALACLGRGGQGGSMNPTDSAGQLNLRLVMGQAGEKSKFYTRSATGGIGGSFVSADATSLDEGGNGVQPEIATDNLAGTAGQRGQAGVAARNSGTVAPNGNGTNGVGGAIIISW